MNWRYEKILDEPDVEFESRWTRGMKSRWTDYLDEPTLPPTDCFRFANLISIFFEIKMVKTEKRLLGILYVCFLIDYKCSSSLDPRVAVHFIMLQNRKKPK